MESGKEIQIHYNAKKDLLYIRLDERKQEVVNRRPSEDIVLDIGEGDRLVGIEIMDASKHLDVESLLPVKYQVSP
jgi:uncharacterized protein YuzE